MDFQTRLWLRKTRDLHYITFIIKTQYTYLLFFTDKHYVSRIWLDNLGLYLILLRLSFSTAVNMGYFSQILEKWIAIFHFFKLKNLYDIEIFQ